MRSIFALFTLAILAPASALAEDAPVLPSTCGADGKTLCVDADADGSFANATDAAAKDCNDDKASVYPGARLVLGDDLDNNCDNVDDDAELEEAVTAAGNGDAEAPKAVAYRAEIDRCLNGSWYVEESATGVWGWNGRIYTCIDLGKGLTYERGGVGYVTAADRASRARAAQLEAKIGHPATQDSPATGMYLELEQTLKAAKDAAGEAKRILSEKAAALQRDIDALKADVALLKVKVSGLETRMGRVEDGITALQSEGMVFGLAPTASLMASGEIYEYEGGPLVRGSMGTSFGLGITLGYGWDGHELDLDLGFGQGRRESESGKLPNTVGTVAVSHLWVGTNAAGGAQVLGVIDSMGNPMTSMVSGWGVGVGGKGMLFVSDPESRNRLALVGTINVLAESCGTNAVWDTKTSFLGSLGFQYARAPERK